MTPAALAADCSTRWLDCFGFDGYHTAALGCTNRRMSSRDAWSRQGLARPASTVSHRALAVGHSPARAPRRTNRVEFIGPHNQVPIGRVMHILSICCRVLLRAVHQALGPAARRRSSAACYGRPRTQRSHLVHACMHPYLCCIDGLVVAACTSSQMDDF